MKIAVYMGAKQSRDEIYDSILSCLPERFDLFILQSIEELESQLRNTDMSSMVTLLAPNERSDMAALFKIRDLLRGVRLVVLLPGHNNTEALNYAHSLYPRYICFQPDGLKQLGPVIENLCRADGSKRNDPVDTLDEELAQ